MIKLLNRAGLLFMDFMKVAAPAIGWTVCTLMLILSIVSSIVSIVVNFLGVCAP